jgi:hypothetical protein
VEEFMEAVDDAANQLLVAADAEPLDAALDQRIEPATLWDLPSYLSG